MFGNVKRCSHAGGFRLLNSKDVVSGGARLVAVVVGGLSMIVMIRFVIKKLPVLKEYSLRIAMLVGMFAAVFVSMIG